MPKVAELLEMSVMRIEIRTLCGLRSYCRLTECPRGAVQSVVDDGTEISRHCGRNINADSCSSGVLVVGKVGGEGVLEVLGLNRTNIKFSIIRE